ncbi:MAG: tetratricopeptide repeat protein [Isosphaeraceae bacterium]
MARADADRHLLFGLMALRHGLIRPPQLVASIRAWTLRKDRDLADFLIEQGSLDPSDRSMVERLVQHDLERHGGDAATCLEWTPAGTSIRKALQGIGDPDLGASLGALGKRADFNGSTVEARPLADLTTSLFETLNTPDCTIPGQAGNSDVSFSGRYELLGEIARGGMGAVLRGRDPTLGRELALKVLLDQHRDRSDLVDRFVEEAQICGQLQHPGVVPVYELGTLADRRPFFAMKLVDGRTLSALLDERDSPATDLPRFLSIFEAICQTMAYVHARGVIHRDLKPSNVMVGAFGEVQVMDWGLAKVLSMGGGGTGDSAQPPPDENPVATIRSKIDSDLSEAGSVLGTPAYMAPEQARGETDLIDRRADVFALGSILCQVLTGVPAFSGETAFEILRAAGQAETTAALGRLAACPADEDLLTLARDCLAARPEDRPADAGVVASRLTDYLTGVQERLRTAELARAAETARAEEAEAKAAAERRARRMTRALAATVLIAAGIFGAGLRWVELDRLNRAEEATDRVEVAIREATRLRGQAQAADVGELEPWKTAAAAAEKASGLLVAEVDPDVRKHAEDLAAEIATGRARAEAAAEAAQRDRRLLDRLADIRSARADDRLGDRTDAAYAEAFREASIDPDAMGPEEAGRRIKERPPEVALAIAMALDDWAAVRRDLLERSEGAKRLTSTARLADPDPWRNNLRDALEVADRAARRDRLIALVASEKDETLPTVSFDLLGKALGDAGAKSEAEAVLRRGRRLHPTDIWLNYDLARALEKLGRREEAIRYYTAARMIRPETAHELAHALVRRGESEEGISVFKDLTRLRPGNGRHLLCLGDTLRERGQGEQSRQILSEAIAVLRKTIAARPNDFYAYLNLASALRYLSDLDPPHSPGMLEESMKLSREAARINPRNVQVHTSIGSALLAYHRHDAAAAEFREALQIDPDDDTAHHGLGQALEGLGRLDEAITCYEDAVRLEPGRADSRIALSTVLAMRGRFDEATSEAREAVRLMPGHAPTLAHLGFCNYRAGRFDEAREAYREALRRDPENDFATNALAWNLATAPGHEKNDPREALALARKAVARAPSQQTNVNTLGICLYRAGELDEAITTLRRSSLLNRGRDASDWFFLAMAHYRLGNPHAAADSFARGIHAFRSFPQEGREYATFWAEASDLFGALGPGPSPSLIKADPDHAMLQLRRAVAAGNVDRRELDESPAFEPLRSRPDFRRLIPPVKSPGPGPR